MDRILPARQGFKFGCDPELFVKNKEGVYVSAEGLIPGTKAEPFKVNRGAVQVDGMAAEFNIDPVDNFADWNQNIATVLSQLQAMLPDGFTLDYAPAVRFDKEVFDSSPDIAKELGCTPDFNAWTGSVNPPPELPDDPYLRTASGHIHIGWTEGEDVTNLQHLINCQDLVKQFDWYLGAWSCTQDTNPERRKLYGQAGACRYKDYGVEYRVLSNFWIKDTASRLAVWNRMQSAINDLQSNFYPEKQMSVYSDLVRSSINTTVLDPVLASTYSYPIVEGMKAEKPRRGKSLNLSSPLFGNAGPQATEQELLDILVATQPNQIQPFPQGEF